MNKEKGISSLMIILIIIGAVIVVGGGVLAYNYYWQKPVAVAPTPPSNCTPNWQCGWGACVNGYQSQIAIDSNNCGVTTRNNIACTALARACTVSTQPSITVISPNGGEAYDVRVKTFQIDYSSSNLGNSTISIDLVGTSGNTISLVTGIKNTGRYLGSIPANTPAGKYKVKVTSWDKSYYATDSSDNSFTITSSTSTQPSITVTSPNGGEVWKIGETHNITWNSTGLDGIVDINLIEYGASSCQSNITLKNIPCGFGLSSAREELIKTGSFSWTISNGRMQGGSAPISAGNYTIQICQRGTTVGVNCDESNNYFGIVAP